MNLALASLLFRFFGFREHSPVWFALLVGVLVAVVLALMVTQKKN